MSPVVDVGWFFIIAAKTGGNKKSDYFKAFFEKFIASGFHKDYHCKQSLESITNLPSIALKHDKAAGQKSKQIKQNQLSNTQYK